MSLKRLLKFLLISLLLLSAFKAKSQNDTLVEFIFEIEKLNPPPGVAKVISIDAKAIAVHNTSNLGDLIKNEGNLYLKSYGPNDLASISIRGGGAKHTKVYWNGMAINSPTLGQLNFSSVPVAFIEHAVIHPGSSGLADGSGGLGGTVQLQNTRESINKYRINFNQEIGEFATYNSSLKGSYKVGKIQAKTTLLQRKSLNNFPYLDISQPGSPVAYRENAQSIQKGIGQSCYLPLKHSDLAFHVNYTDNINGVAAALGATQNGQELRSDNLRMAAEWNKIKPGLFQQMRWGYMADHLQYNDTIALIFSDVTTQSYRYSYRLKKSVTKKLNFVTMAIGQRDEAISSGFSTKKTQNRGAIYLEMAHQIHQNISYEIALRNEIIDEVLTPVTGILGIKYTFTSYLWLTLNFSKNYNAPSLNDLYWTPGGNPNLLPEKSKNSETNLNYSKGNTTIELTSFYSFTENWIQWLPGDAGYWQPQNIKEVLRQGFETMISQKIKFKKTEITLKGLYNYTSAVNKYNFYDPTHNTQLIYVPKHTVSLSVNARIKQTAFFYRQAITGKTYIDASNNWYMPYFAPASAGISFDFKEYTANGARITLSCNNLFDEDYQIMANRPMPGRYFTLTFSFNLDQ